MRSASTISIPRTWWRPRCIGARRRGRRSIGRHDAKTPDGVLLFQMKQESQNGLLRTYRKVTGWPCGHWLFSRAVCFKAPYFGSIRPTIRMLEPGRCEATIPHRRAVTNHLGTVHAIALCNLAELCAGVMTDASLPAGMRWIPKGMTVQYLKKAVGTMRGVALP